MKRAIIALLIIGVIGAGAGAYYIKHNATDIQVNTSPATRGDLIDTVGATGTLQAVVTVQVGSQVSGNISWLGADFNSIVHKDQVVARLDPSLFDAQVAQAKANLVKSTADTEHNKVALIDAQTKSKRAQELATRSLIPQSDLDASKIAVDEAQAMLQSSQATIEQSKANLNQAQVNLDHTVITAPINGIVIQRSVDVGQTVAASMQAPTIFIIAADLTKMQVNANIDEADVGRIRPGQTVTFRVDAYPGEEFQGTVAQIRLQPVVVQNVTTYGTIVDVPNKDLKLKPGMTANLKVQIAKRTDVLRVPNASLRFRPTADIFAALNQPAPPEAQFAGGRGGGKGGQGGGGGRGSGGGQGAPAASLQQGPSLGGSAAPMSRAGAPGGRSGGADTGNADDADRRARSLERFKSMSPDEQKQFIDRMKSRGQDVSAYTQAQQAQDAAKKKAAKAAAPKSPLMTPKYGAPQSAETIDALFAPLVLVETRGRAWLYMNKELKPVNLRLGITDGTNTELLSGELQPGMELVTSVIMGNVRPSTTGSGSGNPLLPQRGGPGGFGGPGGGGRGR